MIRFQHIQKVARINYGPLQGNFTTIVDIISDKRVFKTFPQTKNIVKNNRTYLIPIKPKHFPNLIIYKSFLETVKTNLIIKFNIVYIKK